ncbi:hypothetical protein EXS56_01360 [Candidatus Kaiserbacteria bacterium]|nr:hypothetical protein [Candidatus Kaiserbacteria bacterium]
MRTDTVTSPLMGPAEQERFVVASTRLYKKTHDRTRTAAVTKKVRAYARDVLPDLMISRLDAVVLATEDEDFQ